MSGDVMWLLVAGLMAYNLFELRSLFHRWPCKCHYGRLRTLIGLARRRYLMWKLKGDVPREQPTKHLPSGSSFFGDSATWCRRCAYWRSDRIGFSKLTKIVSGRRGWARCMCCNKKLIRTTET